MDKKKERSNKINNYNKVEYNTVPNIVFKPYKKNKKKIVISMIISNLILIFAFFSITFNADNLKELSQFAINIILVVGALGIAMFSLPITGANIEERKREVVLRYIGEIGALLSTAILGYIISIFGVPLFKLIPIIFYEQRISMIIKTYCIILVNSLLFSLLHTLASFVAYFNIRE